MDQEKALRNYYKDLKSIMDGHSGQESRIPASIIRPPADIPNLHAKVEELTSDENKNPQDERMLDDKDSHLDEAGDIAMDQ